MWPRGHGRAWQRGGIRVIVAQTPQIEPGTGCKTRVRLHRFNFWRNDLMSDAVKVGFVPFSAAPGGVLVVFCDDALKLGAITRKALGKAADLVKRAAETNQFKGKTASVLDILAPEGIKIQRLIVVGTGKPAELQERDFLKFGGVVAGKLNGGSKAVTVLAELAEAAMTAGQAAALATGARLRAYQFTRYKTKKKDGEDGPLRAEVSIAVDDVGATRKAFAPT